eukprot:scaffold88632_cov30-Tisochrysis_lutea.AAC.4
MPLALLLGSRRREKAGKRWRDAAPRSEWISNAAGCVLAMARALAHALSPPTWRSQNQGCRPPRREEVLRTIAPTALCDTADWSPAGETRRTKGTSTTRHREDEPTECHRAQAQCDSAASEVGRRHPCGGGRQERHHGEQQRTVALLRSEHLREVRWSARGSSGHRVRRGFLSIQARHASTGSVKLGDA